MPALGEKRNRFVSGYRIGLNATQAAISAGYSAGSQQGGRCCWMPWRRKSWSAGNQSR
ncbi:terminase small subunit [Shinella sp. G-2]|uniref:terminase small subunit n=1 Tax=Shinella sp. G-2 TaxID=3133141 RepID=UPI003D007656